MHKSFVIILASVALAIFLVGQTTFCHADQNWQDSCEVGPFSCRANFPMKRIEPFLSQLFDLQNDLVNLLGISPAEEKIELLLFRDEWTYRSYLRRNFPNIPYRRALFIKHNGPGTVLVHWSKDFTTDVRHECTHALLHASLPMVPLWLDEGLAEYHEPPAKKRAFDNPNAKKLKLPLVLGDGTKLEQLEGLASYDKMDGNDYRDCWAWVHFMLHGSEEAHDELVQFIQEIGSGNHPGLMSERLAQRLSRPTVRCANHHRSWKRR